MGAAFGLVLAAASAWAQNATIDQSRVANGGGASTGNRCTLVGTIGQAEPGFLQAGGVALCEGFWSLDAEPPPQTIIWVNTSGGNWSNPANWSPPLVPGPRDNVWIARGSGYTVTLDTDATAGSLALIAGGVSLSGPGRLTINGPLTWGSSGGGGTIRATVQCQGGLITGGGVFLYGTLVNGGALTNALSGGQAIYTGNRSVISNLAGASFDFVTDCYTLYNGGARGVIYNAGMFRKSGGTGQSRVQDTFFSTGTVETRSGTLDFQQPCVQTAGITRLREGRLQAEQSLTLSGGTLTGTNTLTGNVTSSGTVIPGNAPGILTIAGNYTQTSAGLLQVELGGTTAGSGFDQLAVSGTATLAGALSVSLINGFTPPANSIYAFLTAGSRAGTFGVTNYPAGVQALVSYAANGATLTVAGTAQPPPLSLCGVRGSSFCLCWPLSAASYSLEWTPFLAGPTSTPWTLIPAALLQTNGNTLSYCEPLPLSGAKFFRLIQP